MLKSGITYYVRGTTMAIRTGLALALCFALVGCGSSASPDFELQGAALAPSTISSGDTVTVTITAAAPVAAVEGSLGPFPIQNITTSDSGTTWSGTVAFTGSAGTHYPSFYLFESDRTSPSDGDRHTYYQIDYEDNDGFFLFMNGYYDASMQGLTNPAEESGSTDIAAPALTVE